MLLLWLTLKSTDTELRKYVLLSQQSAVRYWVRSREGLLRNCVKNSWKQNQYWTKWSVSSLVLPLDGSGRRQRAVKNIFLNVIWSFSNIENDKRTEDRIQSEERICTQSDFWLWLHGIMLLRKTDWSGLVRSFPIITVSLYFILLFVALLTAEEQNQDWKKFEYSHLSNNRGGGGRVAKSINVEVGINVEEEVFWKKKQYIVHRCNERRV